MKPYYEEAGITIFHADCRDVLSHLGNVEAVVTDPPYGVEGGHGGQNRDYLKANYSGDWEDNGEYIAKVCAPTISACIALAQCVALTPGTRHAFLYPQPNDMGCFWSPAAPRQGKFGFACFHPILYYGKNWLSGRAQTPSSRTMNERTEETGHPCAKPLKPWTWLVYKCCSPQGVVLDPFMGSGTTLVAAKNLDRKSIGIEIEEKYCEIAAKRLCQSVFQFGVSQNGKQADNRP